MIKVSIVLPSLNVREYIDECLKSVCEQNLKEVEIICVDAGSTDGTLEVIQSYAKKDNRIRIINSPRKSYGLQMNLGIDAAQGKYIGIVETDDYVRPEMFSTLYEIAEKNSLDFVKADFYRFNHNEIGEEVLYLNKLTDDLAYYNRVLCPRNEKKTFSFVMNTWSGIYKKEFLVEKNIRHNETPGASFQDTDFWFQTFSLADRAYFVNKPYYMNRRDNPNSSVYSNKKIYAFCDEFDFIYEKLFSDGKNKDLLPQFQLYRYRSYMSSLNKCEGEDKQIFANRFKEDLQKSISRNELDLSAFTEGGKKTINLILNDTDKFVSQQLKKKAVEYKLTANSKEVIIGAKASNNPKISIIVPIYNAAKFLDECLNSVFKQTLKDIEIILINDGSTDNSLEIITNYAKRDTRISVLSQPNSGSGIARNFGLTIARGEYIAFMDSDDWYPENNILETLYIKAKSNNAQICGGSFSNSKNGVVTTKFTGTYKKYTFEKEGFIDFSKYQFDYGYHRFIYSKELIEKNSITFPNLLRFQDPPFFLQCMQHAGKFYAIPKVVYCYRKGDNIVKWNDKKIQDLLNGIIFELEFSKKLQYAELHRIACDHLNVDFANTLKCFINFNSPKIIELIFKANNSVDVLLLKRAGYRLDESKPYVIKPIRRFLEQCSPNINSVIVKVNNKEIVFSNQVKESDFEKENTNLKSQLYKLKNGYSYKIGRIVTYIPRQILKCIK